MPLNLVEKIELISATLLFTYSTKRMPAKKTERKTRYRKTPGRRPNLLSCAEKVLDIWTKREDALSRGVRASNPKLIREALGYFKVARGFPGLANTDVQKQLASVIKRFKPLSNSGQLQRERQVAKDVQQLRDRLTKRLNLTKEPLSAASKLLWLKYQDPFVIFDSQAVAALEDLYRCGSRITGYSEYIEQWESAYKSLLPAVKTACVRLAKSLGTSRKWRNHKGLKGTVRRKWFVRRVFDQYLWQWGVKVLAARKGGVYARCMNY